MHNCMDLTTDDQGKLCCSDCCLELHRMQLKPHSSNRVNCNLLSYFLESIVHNFDIYVGT